MKVLLISENRCRENLVPFPIGLACVAAEAKEAGHEVMGLDLMFGEDPALDVAEAIRRFRPDCVGLSIRNIDNQDIYNSTFFLPQVREIVRAIRAETDAPVVAGGSGFTIFPLECLDYLNLEMGVVGEGEGAFVSLLRCLEEGGDPRKIPGLAIRREGKVNPPGPKFEFRSAGFPDRTVFDLGSYESLPLAANLQARRGCHMKCIYCPNPMLEGRDMRLREPCRVADELESLERDYGMKTAVFTDSLFNYPVDYSLEVCREIAGRGLSIRWGCSFNPFAGAEELLERMREAGCFCLSIGNESGSEKMLSALRKGFSREDIVRTVREAQRVGLKTNCFLLLGGPGETRRSVEESVEFLTELAPDMVTVTVGIRIYPGCELKKIAVWENVIHAGQNLLYPAFYISEEVKPWLREYAEEACRRREGWTL